MDFPENHENLFTPEEMGVPRSAAPYATAQSSGIKPPAFNQKPRKRSGWKIFCRIIFIFSIIANIVLFASFIGYAAIFDTGGASGGYIEETIVPGPSDKKIAIVNLYGIIDNELCYEVTTQLKQAAKDEKVKAVIVRTVSPGGTVSASDRIHHQISLLRQETGKPVVAFMQTVAASGGYYTSVACTKIIAEPTTITGSIGVIMNHLTIKELLEEKLGITPVTIKSGEKKDWPSIFTETTEQQKEYLFEKLITPAYNRFVDLVTKGRRDVLTPSEVKELANGSIFSADEALAKKLIDEIGYIDEAVELAKSLANMEDARVIEYKKPQSLLSVLTAQSKNSWIPNRNSLQELAVPKLLYLWNANW